LCLRTISILIFVVNSIALVKPEKAKMMEGMLIQMARSGQIAGKVTINVNVQAVRKIILCYMVTSPQNMV